MSRTVLLVGSVGFVADMNWPSFLTESARSYAKQHGASKWIKVGDNTGFFVSEETAKSHSADFEGALFSVAATVYSFFQQMAVQNNREVAEFDILVLLPSDNVDEVIWVRMDNGIITQDLILTGVDTVERLRHLPAYVAIYSALQTQELPHANIKPMSWRLLLGLGLPNAARVRSAKLTFQDFKKLDPKIKMYVGGGLLGLVILAVGAYGVSFALKKSKTIAPVKETGPIDHTELYWEKLAQDQAKAGDKAFAQQVWDYISALPLLEDGFSRARVTCRTEQCNTDWRIQAGDIRNLEAKFKVSSISGNSAVTEEPFERKGVRKSSDPTDGQKLDKVFEGIRTELQKIDKSMVIDLRPQSQVSYSGFTNVTRLVSQRTFVIRARGSSFPDILNALPADAIIDQVDVTIESNPVLTIEGKFYVI